MEGLGVSSVQHLQALSSLLSTQHGDEGDEGDEDCKKGTAHAGLGPGHIGPPPKRDKQASTSREKKNNKDIWSEEEVAEGSQYDDLADPRPQPEYEILLKQSVGTEDLFLGLNRKDPSSMCCEAMLVKIKLPDTEATDVVLDVKEKFLDLRTPKYKLGLHLPHPTHSHGGTARFFPESGALEVTLLFKRPMDEINMP
ncbi:protein PIH1D3 [Cyclopterus lumpus]|uniref:protein PIH1D3 n=1 Tax=Cyclopterus lumpus TaxID=8103 RepID=UPI001485D83E|nr:protein PIH1D3 [Cyclopterus lumpus]XP_034410790.1 protein PIH1D3 [Cyclopterus lumpus]